MLGAQAFTQGSAAAREARLKNEELIDKTRTGGGALLNEKDATKEAWDIYEEAREKNGGEVPTSEQLTEIFGDNVPAEELAAGEAWHL